MNHYLLLARSITHAQDMVNVLGKAGIGASVRRAGPSMAERGCGYSIQISEQRFSAAMQALRASGKMPVKVFHLSGNDRREVSV